MLHIIVAVFTALSAAAAASASAQAAVIGYHLSGASGRPAAAISASGNTPFALTGLSAADLARIDVLWILNGINGNPDATVLGNTGAVSNFVAAGGVLSFHDRNVAQGVSASTYIPGASGVSFVSNFSTNIDVLASLPVTAGITNTTLDGGNFSNHGYALLGSRPAGALSVFSNGNANQIVDFYYGFGAGEVCYSTIPLDFYLGGGGSVAAFSTLYAPQEAGFQASLAKANVPEPATLGAFALGLLALGFVRSRRRAKQ